MLAVEHVEHCSLSSLSSMSSASSTARLARCRACQALLAQLAVEHVEHCSLVKLSSMQIIVLRATCCVVVNISRCFRARLVTLFLFSKIFVLKVKRLSSCLVSNKVVFVLHSKSNATIH